MTRKLYILLSTCITHVLCYVYVVIRLACSIGRGIHVLVVLLHVCMESWFKSSLVYVTYVHRDRDYKTCITNVLCYLYVVIRLAFSIGRGIHFLVVILHVCMESWFNSSLVYLTYVCTVIGITKHVLQTFCATYML